MPVAKVDPGFVHLRVHSAYSLLEGALKTDEIVALCHEHGMPAIAITDSGNLFGALEFAQKCAARGIQPIIGCQINVTRPEAESELDGQRGGRAAEPDHLILLVQNETGYRNLMGFVSAAFLETEPGQTPQISLETLADRSAGLIALSGGPRGTVGRLLADGQEARAETVLARLAGIFPGRFYIELMRHQLEIEDRIEPGLLSLAYRHDLPLVATNDVFFRDPDMFEAHDALLCVAEGKYVEDENRRRETLDHWLKPGDQMTALFSDIPEAIQNTVAIARRCAYFPTAHDPILPAFPTAAGRDEAAELHAQAKAGLDDRLARLRAEEMAGTAEAYHRRFDFEIEIIVKMGFAGYFLIVSDFIRWAKNEGIPVGPGRGSGAGSVVAWALRITDLDPLRFGLLFERFLNPERVSMPDFDVDFCQERRDEVLHYVQDRYGHDRVAQIITFGKLQARAVLRDVGRVLQMPYGQVDRICKLVPNNPANPVTLQEAVDGEPALQDMRANDPSVRRLVDIGLKLEGLYRHASTHAAGVVIGDRPLHELIPLYRDPRAAMPVTQFSMKYAEAAGLVKFDFLGLKTLTVLAYAIRHLRARGTAIDLETLTLDDRATYEMLGRGDSTGVFQMESAGMRDVLRKLQPDRFEDLIAVVALYRPGPMENIPSYIDRKHGREKPDYLHPTLEDILKETFGIMIYQEQVMQIAQVLSGYSLGNADLLRRAMGKKIKSEMEAQRQAFIEGAVARGVDEPVAQNIFEQVNKFAGYGFNKSHAAAYALIAYQTAYLKANHPVEFLAATMTLDLDRTEKLAVFKQEVERLAFRVLPPDINRSEAVFSVEDDTDGRPALRYALGAIRNVGEHAMEQIVAERRANGPFASLEDFAQRLDPRAMNRRQLENLVKAGAFDRLNDNRAGVFGAIDGILKIASAANEDRQTDQPILFGEDTVELRRDLEIPDCEDWAVLDRLAEEFDAMGFYLSAHPLDAYGPSLARLGVVPAAGVEDRLSGTTGRLVLAGTVTGKQERTSAKGSRFAFVQLSDPTGTFEVTVFSEMLRDHRDLLESGKPLLLAVEGRMEEGGARLIAQKLEPLDQAVARLGDELQLVLEDRAAVDRLARLFEADGPGRSQVTLIVPLAEGGTVEVELRQRYALSGQLRAQLQALPGVRPLGALAAE
ncbi:MAG: DNA polymerase III subunit alpha [Alphaproteobacteria bacterium]